MKIKSESQYAEQEPKLFALIRSRIDSWNILKFLLTWCRIMNPNNTARGLIFVKKC